MDKKEIEKILLLFYIALNGMCTGYTVNAITDISKGLKPDSINNIVLAGAAAIFTATRAIHYYKLTNEQKGK